jgi:transcriptional regulator with XRE-family HTH domain
MEDIKESIGLRLKEIRLLKKLSQEQLSAKAGVNRSWISHIENGRRNISVETLNILLKVLKVSFKSFFSNKLFDK